MVLYLMQPPPTDASMEELNDTASLDHLIDFSQFALNLSASTGTQVTVETLKQSLKNAVAPNSRRANTHTGREVISRTSSVAVSALTDTEAPPPPTTTTAHLKDKRHYN